MILVDNGIVMTLVIVIMTIMILLVAKKEESLLNVKNMYFSKNYKIDQIIFIVKMNL